MRIWEIKMKSANYRKGSHLDKSEACERNRKSDFCPYKLMSKAKAQHSKIDAEISIRRKFWST